MRSDQDIERLLEDWLADVAQPMPQEILENSLESVARTPQARSRAAGWAWRPGAVGVLAAAAVLILVIAASGLTIDRIGSWFPSESATAGQMAAWDPVIDFGRWANRNNPSPDSYGNPSVWSYLSGSLAHTPAAYERLSTLEGATWNDPRFVNLFATLDSGGLVLHPWKGADFERFIILAWRSPVSGEVSLAGSVTLIDDTCTGSGISLSVDREAASLFSREIPTAGSEMFALTTTVDRGESLYFIIGSGFTSSCDSTRITLEITRP